MEAELFSVPILAAIVAIVVVFGKIIEIMILKVTPEKSILTDREKTYLRDIHELVNKCDSDGTPLMYVPRSLAEVQKELQNVMITIVNDQRRIAEILERIERKIDKDEG